MAGERRFTDAHGALIHVETGKYFHLFLYSEITTSQVVDLIIGTPLVRRSGTPFFSRSFITTYLNMHKLVQSLDPIMKCHIRKIGWF